MLIFLAMFGMGLVLGFVGAGGAGVVIAVLTVVFNVPIHTALGTSLGAMAFTTLSGVYSHFREGNVVTKCGVAVGIFGCIGAFLGVRIATLLPEQSLAHMTAYMLFLCAALVWFRMRFSSLPIFSRFQTTALSGPGFWVSVCGVGMVAGLASGTFGIGGAPFIQIGLLVFFSLTLPQVAGTTMLVMLPIALAGGVGYLAAGFMEMSLFIKVILGLMIGTYIGAKFTRRVHPAILKSAMVIVPILGGLVLLLK